MRKRHICKSNELYKIRRASVGIKEATKYVEKVTGKQQRISNGYILATNSRNADTVANYILTHGMTNLNGDINIGKSFTECIKNIKPDNIVNFDKYLVLKHSLSWIEPENPQDAKRVFADDTLQDTVAIKSEIEKLEANFPGFESSANDLYEYQDNLLRYFVVEAGGMSEDVYQELKHKYPYYVPFRRAVNSGRSSKKTKASFANQKTPLSRAKGSGLEIISPLQSIIENTHNMVKFAMRNRVMQVLCDYSDNVEGFGQFMEKVKPNYAAHSIGMTKYKEKISETLEEALNAKDYLTVTEALDEILGDSVTSYSPVAISSKKIVTVLRNGKLEYYQVHNEALYEAITEFTPAQVTGILKLSHDIMMPMKLLVTQNNPIFALTNAMRDFGTAYKNSNVNNIIEFSKNYFNAVLAIIQKSDSYKQYLAMGGGHSSELSAYRDKLQSELRKIAMKDNGIARRVLAGIIHPIDTVANFNDIIESAPRLAEFINSLNKDGDLQKAIYNADDITTNFKRAGKEGKVLNNIFIYHNAGVQGNDKFIRSFTDATPEERKKRIAKYLISALLMSSLLTFWNEKKDKEEYEYLSSYIKNNYYVFALGNGKFLKFPKARQMAIMNSLTERTLELFMGNEEAFYDFGGYIMQQIIVPGLPDDLSSLDGMVHDVLGSTVLGPVVDLGYNKDFKGTPIVPKSYEYVPKEEQYNERTTETAKVIAKLFGTSPLKVGHLISSYLGILGQLNNAVAFKDNSQRDWTFGIKNKFTSDAYYSTDVINKVYDKRDKAKAKYQKDKTSQSMALYGKYNTMTGFISQYSDTVETLNEEEKREARKKLLDKLKTWNIGYTQTENNIVKQFSKSEIDDAKFYVKDFPSSTLEKTENGVKKYYTLTPDEFIQFTDDFLNALEENRADAMKYNSDEESIKDELKKAWEDSAKEVRDKYKSKFDEKFKEK